MPGLLYILCVRSLNQAVHLADEIIELTLSFTELLPLLRFEFFASCSYVNQKIVWGGEGKNEKRCTHKGTGVFRHVSAKNERGGVLLTISVSGLAKFDQCAEEGDALQQGAVADDQHTFTRTSQRHIEFAVDPLSVLVFKLRAAEEGKL